MTDTITLYRPTGPEEIALVRQSGFRRWPPRLPDQPIFYPVTNEEYAIQIARDWNVKASGYGCVTRFQVRKSFMDRYPVQQVGGSQPPWEPDSQLRQSQAQTAKGKGQVPLHSSDGRRSRRWRGDHGLRVWKFTAQSRLEGRETHHEL